ncbi:cytochrome c-type biogenesis protein CcmH, partial [Aggregatibacter actinomycetemcomitans]
MKRFLALFFLLISVGAFAEMVDTFEFHNPADRARAVELAKSLRCPQCQNQ